MIRFHKLLLATPMLFILAAPVAAQTSSVKMYGVIDQYLGYTNAQGTGSKATLDSGAYMASRLGFLGSENLGNGVMASFTLEHGFSADTGAAADATRFFNRQSWIGLSGSLGDVRLGRQNSPQFYMLGGFDAFNASTYGSILGNVSNYSARFDNMLHYISPSLAGFKVQVGTARGEQGAPNRSGLNAYIAALDYTNGPWYVGINHVRQNSADQTFTVKATFLGGNYDYGRGKVYLGLYAGNNPGASAAANVAGRDYRIWSLSGDFLITPQWAIGVLYGRANDTTASNRDANEASVIVRYDLSKRTMLYSVASKLNNKNGGNFSLGAAAPIVRNVPAPGGDTTGIEVGIRHLF